VYCNSCGAKNPDQAQFCSKCGGGLTEKDVLVVPEAVTSVPSAGTAAAAPAPIYLTEEDHQTAKGFAGLSLLLVLFSVFGGAGMAAWWVFEGDGDDSISIVSIKMEFGLTEILTDMESEVQDGEATVSESEEDDIEYSDRDCGCDEMEDLMGTVGMLGYVAILAAAFFVYAAFYQNDGRTLRTAALVMGGAGLLTAGYFGMNWTDAFDEDTGWFEDADEMDPSFLGTAEITNSAYPDEEGFKYSWKPWLGWGAMLLSGFLGIAYYVTLEFD